MTPILSCFYARRRLSRLHGRLLFASRLRKPRRLSLICFRPPASGVAVSSLILRLCGLPGDLLEIRKGILYLNGVDVDKGLYLTHVFKVNRAEAGAIRHDPRLSYSIPSYPDLVYLTLADKYVRDARLPCQQHILPPGLRSDSIYKAYKKNWNEDNFGPVKVPRGQWFVLGDDRSHSIDSRHLGFIDQKKFLGTVL